jgi:hypothetical protein
VSATCPVADQSSSIVRKNMARIKLLTVAGPLLCHAAQANRVVRLLENCRAWGLDRPLVMLAVYSDDERVAAERFQTGTAHDLARYVIIQQKGHNETVGNAIGVFRQQFDPTTDPFTAKRQSLYLTRRGGKEKANFVSPFLGGAGTTCGEWTKPMVRWAVGTTLSPPTRGGADKGMSEQWASPFIREFVDFNNSRMATPIFSPEAMMSATAAEMSSNARRRRTAWPSTSLSADRT